MCYAENILEELCLIKLRVNPVFCEILAWNSGKTFVEKTSDLHWGCGWKADKLSSLKESELLDCPGKNRMGEILNRIAVFAEHFYQSGLTPGIRDFFDVLFPRTH